MVNLSLFGTVGVGGHSGPNHGVNSMCPPMKILCLSFFIIIYIFPSEHAKYKTYVQLVPEGGRKKIKFKINCYLIV